MRSPVELPDELVPALGHGLVNPGTYFNTGRWAQLGFLIELGIKFKELGSAERSEVMGDPWAFRDMAYSITGQGPATQRHALLHLFFPQDFEAIVSDDHIGRIIDRFRDHTTGKTDDPARQIQEIRDALTPRYGKGFDFYDIRLRPLWQDQEDPWPELVGWARKFTEPGVRRRGAYVQAGGRRPARRRAQRCPLERRVAGARDQGGVTNSKNNLTPWQVNDSFKKWIEADPDDARTALVALWDSEEGPGRRVQAFSDRCPSSISSPGQKVALASYLLMGTDPENLPVYRPDPFKKIYELVGTSMYARTEGERYERRSASVTLS
ncbi:MAG: hypothetical protein M5U31_00310 [Acidimicrobiia bacterium]|nr:hypothetical protein [Acidimicrobiia bacterium]